MLTVQQVHTDSLVANSQVAPLGPHWSKTVLSRPEVEAEDDEDAPDGGVDSDSDSSDSGSITNSGIQPCIAWEAV